MGYCYVMEYFFHGLVMNALVYLRHTCARKLRLARCGSFRHLTRHTEVFDQRHCAERFSFDGQASSVQCVVGAYH